MLQVILFFQHIHVHGVYVLAPVPRGAGHASCQRDVARLNLVRGVFVVGDAHHRVSPMHLLLLQRLGLRGVTGQVSACSSPP